MKYILVALFINAHTGEPTHYERVGAPFDTPEACLEAQVNQPLQKVLSGEIKVFGCIRQDALREQTI